jgi:hypothetical protein
MAAMVDFQSYAGPGDKTLRNNAVEGYQPVSRIGEVVINSFIDSYEFTNLEQHLTAQDMGVSTTDTTVIEYKPMFHEWATVQPGMICLARKKRTSVFRSYVAAETAVPVISCAACLPKTSERDFFFAGIARSKSVREPDDGIGPSQDEFFTLSIGGMATILNTQNGPVHPGDLIEWTLTNDGTSTGKRTTHSPRRVGIAIASSSSAKVIGRCLTFAKRGETFDLLLKQ